MPKQAVQAGDVTVDLPIVPLPDTNISILLFDSLGRMKLIQDLAAEAVKRFTKPDLIVCPEAKAIPLTQEMARLWGIDYFVLRKEKKLYMDEPQSLQIRSITTAGERKLWYDKAYTASIKHMKIMLFDDVISTGGTLAALVSFAEDNDLNVVSVATIFTEGESEYVQEVAQKFGEIESLGHLDIIVRD